METVTYKIVQIDGDYAHLVKHNLEDDIFITKEETKLVARALLPAEIYEGCVLLYELFEYTII